VHAASRGKPLILQQASLSDFHSLAQRTGNGSHVVSEAINRGRYDHSVELDYSRPGRRIDAKIEALMPASRGVSEGAVVHGSCSAQDRGVASVLSRDTSPHCT
jgi:hypothetical protein